MRITKTGIIDIIKKRIKSMGKDDDGWSPEHRAIAKAELLMLIQRIADLEGGKCWRCRKNQAINNIPTNPCYSCLRGK
ncbi:MAG: hypothetical protein HY376_03175 [Candidatus Blackburnbacteria bacterium]|nr:hypothetical protein [Candidatus Blackburnbacteria bacterium]